MADIAGTNSYQNIYPDYWNHITNGAVNSAAGLPGQIQGTYNNWYNGNLAAAPTGNTALAYNLAGQGNSWTPTVGQALTNYQQTAPSAFIAAGQNFEQGSQYDTDELQKYLNPYVQNAANSMTQQSNQNLQENTLPAVNSTFTGAGQFGSSRNADFNNRAIRDQQQTLTNSLGQLNYGAYQTANQNYSDWANKSMTAGTNMANLGGQLGQFATNQAQLAQMGTNLDNNTINNLASTGNAMQGLQQTEYDKTYEDWLKQQQYPTTAMGGLSQIVGNLSGGVKPDIWTPTPQLVTGTQTVGIADLLSQYLASMTGTK